MTSSQKLLGLSCYRWKNLKSRCVWNEEINPILFSLEVQEYIELLLASRTNFVTSENLFLFPNPNGKKYAPINGQRVLQKYAHQADLQHPVAMTARKLRKHLATVSQLFNMNEQDLEQLSTFMGHTPGVHRSE